MAPLLTEYPRRRLFGAAVVVDVAAAGIGTDTVGSDVVEDDKDDDDDGAAVVVDNCCCEIGASDERASYELSEGCSGGVEGDDI